MANRDAFVIQNGVLTKYIGSDEHVVIPDGVTSIDDYAFYQCNSLTRIEIPDSVTSIDSFAFYGCKNLIQVENGVSYVDKWAIDCDPSVSSVSLRNDTVGIADNAFFNCQNLTRIEIPESVTNIGNSAFSGCSGLTSIEIPKSVTSISAGAFMGCTNLTSITIPDGVTSIGFSAFAGCKNLIQVENGVSYVDKWAIGCATHVSSVSLRNDTVGIADNAFYNCQNLTSITIPDGVTSIAHGAFSGCSGLTSITIPDGVTSIGSYAFERCSRLTSIEIPDGVTSIGNYAFRDNYNLTSIQIPEQCINENLSCVFSQCNNLSQVIVGDNVINISSVDDLKNLKAMVEDLRYNDFIINNNSLEEYWGTNKIVCIPEKINIIGDHAFANNDHITVVNIPSNVQYVDATAFDNCKNLEQIIAPEHLHETLQKSNPNVEILSEPAIYKLSDLVESGRAFIVNDSLISINENVYGRLVIDEHINGIEAGALKNSNITTVEADEKLEKLIADEGKTIERENEHSNNLDNDNGKHSDFVMD